MELPIFFWFVVAGVLGALGRVALQVFRDETVTQTAPEILAEVFLGALGGWVAFQVEPSLLASAAMGFMAPDALENIFRHWSPKPPNDDSG